MEIIRIEENDAERIAPLAADFRMALNAYRGIRSQPDIAAGREEIAEFLRSGFPVYAAESEGTVAGYIICRIDEPCLWVEQLFVREDCRRRGIASLLFRKAEEIAASMGEDTVYNFVHPNNEGVIAFLRAKGYTVLNMLEIRKPWKGEQLTTVIHVEDKEFDY